MQPNEIASQTRLLKANDIRGLGSKVVFNFEDFRRRGDAYVDSVRKQIGDMVATAETDAAQLRKTAQEQGFAEGQRRGLAHADELIENRARELAAKTASEGLATALPALQAVANTLNVERDRWMSEWESTAVRLAAAIAERLLKRQLDLNPELSQAMIRDALQLAVGSPQIRVHLHSEDAAILGDQAAEVARTMGSCGQAEIVPDDSLVRGGCFIETQHGQIDARIGTLLDRVVEELLEGEE